MGRKSKKLSELILGQVKTLADGITSEELSAVYFDNKVIKQPEPLYRLDYKGKRMYYRFVNGNPEFYTSVTTFLHNQIPTSKYLLDWQREHGEDEMLERAHYGTFEHSVFQTLLITNQFDLDKMSLLLQQYATKEKCEYKEEWVEELKKDALSLSQFIIDYKVKPIAIEIILYHPTDGYAGALDLVCEMDYEEKGFFGEVYASGERKGQPKESKRIIRIPAIVDLKSGRKGFDESHVLQLAAYREMWNLKYPELPIEKIFNIAPKGWDTKPAYSLKEQTYSKSILKLKQYVENERIDNLDKNWMLTTFEGKIDLTKGIEQNITNKSLAELVKPKDDENNKTKL
jgi:hypothetical protein